MRNSTHKKNKSNKFVIFSVVLHGLAYVGVIYYLQTAPSGISKKIKVSTISAEDIVRIKDSIEKSKAQQIVNTDLVNKTDKPDPNAKYLSEFNQQVEKEQKAQNVDTYKQQQLAKGAQDSTEQVTSPPDPSQKSGSEKKQTPNKKISLADLGKVDLNRMQNKFGNRQPLGGNGNEELTEVASNNDYLENVQNEGVQTLLNTKEFVYFSYYNRIKKRLDMYWGPTLREKMDLFFRKGRKLASERKRVTKLLVILDKDGIIKQVKVLDDSGISEIDTSAVDAFNKAGPFPHPPEGIVDSDGFIRIRWDFILDTA